MKSSLLANASVPTLGGLALVLQSSRTPVMTVGSLELESFDPVKGTARSTNGDSYRITPARTEPRPTRLPGLGG